MSYLEMFKAAEARPAAERMIVAAPADTLLDDALGGRPNDQTLPDPASVAAAASAWPWPHPEVRLQPGYRLISRAHVDDPRCQLPCCVAP